MFIDPTAVITNLDGEPIKLKKDNADEQLTLGFLVVEALTRNFPDEKPDKSAWIDDGLLADKFHKAKGFVEISSTDRDRLRYLVPKLGQFYAQAPHMMPIAKIAVSRALGLIDNCPAELPKEEEAA